MGDYIMSDYIEFDTSPYDEPGVQVQENADYMPEMRAEAKKMVALLESKFAIAPGYFTIGRNVHDFGTYLDVRYVYDEDDKDCHEWINFIESNFPDTWDDTSVLTKDDFLSWKRIREIRTHGRTTL